MDIMKEVKMLDRSDLELRYMKALLNELEAGGVLDEARKTIATLQRKVRKLTADNSRKASTPEGVDYVEASKRQVDDAVVAAAVKISAKMDEQASIQASNQKYFGKTQATGTD